MEVEDSSRESGSDEDRVVRFEDGSDGSEDLSAARHGDSNDSFDEGSGPESGDETRGVCAHSSLTSRSKHATVQEVGHYLPDVTFEMQANRTAGSGRPWKSGNTYSRVRVSNEARVQLGDSITVNNHYSVPNKAGGEPIIARVELTEESLKTLLAAISLVKTLLQTATGLLVLLQATMSAYRLPKQIDDELAFFEDALGRFQRIDLRFLDNWPAFRRRLACDFQETPGSRRILEMRYRLFDRVGGNYIVDPRRPPPFASVFRQGRHVQMSIHFEWDEVSDEECPRCGLEQDCKADAETICARCGFFYRGQVQGARVDEMDAVDDEETPPSLPEQNGGNVRRLSHPNHHPGKQEQTDAPSSFNRITISKPPIISPYSRPLTHFETLHLFALESHSRECSKCEGRWLCATAHGLSKDVRKWASRHNDTLYSRRADSEGRWARVEVPRGYERAMAILGGEVENGVERNVGVRLPERLKRGSLYEYDVKRRRRGYVVEIKEPSGDERGR